MPNGQPWDIKLQQLESVLAESTVGFQKIGKLITELYGAMRTTMNAVDDQGRRLDAVETRLGMKGT